MRIIFILFFTFFGIKPSLATELQDNNQSLVKFNKNYQSFISAFNAFSFHDVITKSDLLYDVTNIDDTRTEVIDTFKNPYKNVGLIQIVDGEDAYLGTGTLIAPNYILSVAHNCVDCIRSKTFQPPRSFLSYTFYRQFSRSKFFDERKVKAFYIPKDYCAQQGNDIAILELEDSKNSVDATGFISLPIDYLKQKSIKVIGYPGDIDLREGEPVMIEDEGQIIFIKNNEIAHNANTDYGNSGSPIILQDEIQISNKLTNNFTSPIIGVHARRSDIDSGYNYATLINKHFHDIKNILGGNIPENWYKYSCTIKQE